MDIFKKFKQDDTKLKYSSQERLEQLLKVNSLINEGSISKAEALIRRIIDSKIKDEPSIFYITLEMFMFSRISFYKYKKEPNKEIGKGHLNHSYEIMKKLKNAKKQFNGFDATLKASYYYHVAKVFFHHAKENNSVDDLNISQKIVSNGIKMGTDNTAYYDLIELKKEIQTCRKNIYMI